MLYTPLQPEEYYAYIGLLPFVALLLLPLAVLASRGGRSCFFALLVAFAVLWMIFATRPCASFTRRARCFSSFATRRGS